MDEFIIPLIPEAGETKVLVSSHGAMISTIVQLFLAPSGPYGFKAASIIPDPLGSCWNTSITEVLLWYSQDVQKHAIEGAVLRWSDAGHLEAADGRDQLEATDAKAV